MNKDFKCAQFIDVYYPQIDGVVSTVNNYAHTLNQSARCCVVAPRYGDCADDFDYDVYRIKGIKIPFYKYAYGMPAFDPGIYRALLNLKPNIVHAHSPFEVGKLSQRIAAKLDIPVVATFHTKFYDDFKQIFKSDPIAQLLTEQVIRFYEKCDRVWAVNASTASTMRDYGYKGEIQIMPNGTDLDYYDRHTELEALARSQYNLPPDKKLLIFVGQITWKKNLKFVIDSIARLKKERDDFCMLFVGTSYCAEEIQRYAEKHIPSHYRFLGLVDSRELLAGLYSAASLMFFPSIYDNAPLVVREAAQMHCPSLLIENTNAAEGVSHGINGFLCANDAAKAAELLNALLSSPETLSGAGDTAALTIPIPWSEVIESVLHEYRQICKEYTAKAALYDSSL